MTYKEALIKDKRTYFQYYLSLIKIKELIIFTFFISHDYNSKIIKISLFFFFFALFFTVNALFFNGSNIHKIFIEKGKFNFIYQLPKIFYSSIITNIINITINYFSLTEKEVIGLKRQKNYIIKKYKKYFKMYKNKIYYFLFFIIFNINFILVLYSLLLCCL